MKSKKIVRRLAINFHGYMGEAREPFQERVIESGSALRDAAHDRQNSPKMSRAQAPDM